MAVVEIVQRLVIGVIVFDQIDVLPFIVDVGPELVEEGVDIRIRVAAPFTGEVIRASVDFR